MKKTSLIFIILFSFSFSFTERPTGYQLDDPGTALWVSFINNVDALGANMYGNVGLDFSISEKLEMCFDLGREFGSDFSETSQSFQFRWWIGSDLSLNFARDFGENSNDSDFLGIKFLTGDSWIAFTKDGGNEDNSIWSLGRVWNRKGKMNLAISYHFSSDDIDKGNLQLAFGKAI